MMGIPSARDGQNPLPIKPRMMGGAQVGN